MEYNSGSNRASNFKLAERVVWGCFEIMSPIIPELYDTKFNFLLIALITQFEIKKSMWTIFVLKTSRVFSIILKVGGKQQKKKPFKCMWLTCVQRRCPITGNNWTPTWPPVNYMRNNVQITNHNRAFCHWCD